MQWTISRFQGRHPVMHSAAVRPMLQDHSGMLLLMTYGGIQLKLAGKDEPIALRRGELAYLPPGSQPSVVQQEGKVYELYVLGFTVDRDEIRQLELPAAHQSLKTIRYDWMLERFRTLAEEDKERLSNSTIRGWGIVLELLALWSRENSTGAAAPATARHLERMKEFIQDRYREKVTKEDLGRCIGRTPNYAATLFRQGTGQTISGYVHTQRMKTAVYMLTESLLTIEEIADYLGYGEVSYFQRIFRRSFGMPPSHYASRHE
ncbi:helix-turn-helix transcriptional regulator [Paenibacillus herberti]|nr:AraC family transcriptional regulator [Paenibacillus herberti]